MYRTGPVAVLAEMAGITSVVPAIVLSERRRRAAVNETFYLDVVLCSFVVDGFSFGVVALGPAGGGLQLAVGCPLVR